VTYCAGERFARKLQLKRQPAMNSDRDRMFPARQPESARARLPAGCHCLLATPSGRTAAILVKQIPSHPGGKLAQRQLRAGTSRWSAPIGAGILENGSGCTIPMPEPAASGRMSKRL